MALFWRVKLEVMSRRVSLGGRTYRSRHCSGSLCPVTHPSKGDNDVKEINDDETATAANCKNYSLLANYFTCFPIGTILHSRLPDVAAGDAE